MRFARQASIVAIAISLFAASACSSSGGGGGGGATSSAATSASSSGTGQIQSAAAALLAKYTKPPTSIGITAPLSKLAPAGKHVVVMDCTLGSCVDWADSAIAAGQALGWNMERIRTGTTPQTITAAFDQAVRAKPDAVISIALSRSLFAPEAKALAAEGTLVVTNEDPEGVGGGVIASVDSSLSEAGMIEALAVLAAKGSAANAVFVSSPEYAITTSQIAGFKAEYTKMCPSCGFAQFLISAADVANGKSTTEMVGYLRSHTSVNYVALGYDPILGAFPPALKAAGLVGKVSVVGQAPTAQQFKYIQDGTVWKASVMAPIIEEGWHTVDALARAFVGDPVDASTTVTLQRLLATKNSIPAGALDHFVSYIPNYQEQFKKLWLVGQ